MYTAKQITNPSLWLTSSPGPFSQERRGEKEDSVFKSLSPGRGI
jgi:hypothetical protein